MFFERRIRKSTTKQTKTKLCSAFQKGLKESSYFCFLAEMETPSKMNRHSWRRCGAEDITKYICLLFLFFVPVKSLVVDGLFRAQTDLALWSKYGYTYVLCRAFMWTASLQCAVFLDIVSRASIESTPYRFAHRYSCAAHSFGFEAKNM